MTYRFLIPIASIFTATLTISNTFDTKIFIFFGLNLPAGIVLFPLSYLSGDSLTAVYGYSISRRIIWSALIAIFMTVFAYELGCWLPPAEFWKHQDAFDAIFSHIPRLVSASILAYLCGEFTNSFIVAKMKVIMDETLMWIRFVSSTIAGPLVDIIVFVLVAFSGQFTTEALLSITLSAWMVKVAWEIIALPFTLFFAKRLKKAEGEDFYDRDTNFNPFHI